MKYKGNWLTPKLKGMAMIPRPTIKATLGMTLRKTS